MSTVVFSWRDGLLDAYYFKCNQFLIEIYLIYSRVFLVNCCGAAVGREQQHNQDLREIHKVGRIPSSETQGQSVGPGKKARQKFSSMGGTFSACGWKLLSRLFSRPDWPPLGLRGWTNSRIHHFLAECIAFNQRSLRPLLPECIAPRTTQESSVGESVHRS